MKKPKDTAHALPRPLPKIVAGTVHEDPHAAIDRAVAWLISNYKKVSPAEALTDMTHTERGAWLSSLSEIEQKLLEYDWYFWARPKQRFPDGEWTRWILTAGRGFGKTRTGAEWVRYQIETGKCRHMALVAANAKDLRRVIVEDQRGGGSGLLQICPPWNMPEYSPTKMRLTWVNPNFPSYGASCSLYSAEEPDSLRGPAHDGAWVDELCKWPRAQEAWDQLQFGLRIGASPQTVITTTPAPTPLFLKMIEEAQADIERRIYRITTGSTFENRANLSEGFLKEILNEYEGTRLGRQELYAEVLQDIEGALWTRDLIDAAFLPQNADLPEIRTRVVGVDPQMSQTGERPLSGIIVAAASAAAVGKGRPVQGYVLADRSVDGSPVQWARAIVEAYHDYECHWVIAERNQGGDLVASNIHNIDPNVRVKLITATKSKGERAIPVVSRYEQRRVFHVGHFDKLEKEMLMFIPGDEKKKRSPNRVDALVHALDYLLVAGQRAGVGIAITRRI